MSKRPIRSPARSILSRTSPTGVSLPSALVIVPISRSRASKSFRVRGTCIPFVSAVARVSSFRRLSCSRIPAMKGSLGSRCVLPEDCDSLSTAWTTPKSKIVSNICLVIKGACCFSEARRFACSTASIPNMPTRLTRSAVKSPKTASFETLPKTSIGRQGGCQLHPPLLQVGIREAESRYTTSILCLVEVLCPGTEQ